MQNAHTRNIRAAMRALRGTQVAEAIEHTLGLDTTQFAPAKTRERRSWADQHAENRRAAAGSR